MDEQQSDRQPIKRTTETIYHGQIYFPRQDSFKDSETPYSLLPDSKNHEVFFLFPKNEFQNKNPEKREKLLSPPEFLNCSRAEFLVESDWESSQCALWMGPRLTLLFPGRKRTPAAIHGDLENSWHGSPAVEEEELEYGHARSFGFKH